MKKEGYRIMATQPRKIAAAVAEFVEIHEEETGCAGVRITGLAAGRWNSLTAHDFWRFLSLILGCCLLFFNTHKSSFVIVGGWGAVRLGGIFLIYV